MIVFLVHYQTKFKLNTCDFERAFYYAAYAFIDNLKDEGKYNFWVQRVAGAKDLEKIAKGFTLARSDLETREYALNYIEECLSGVHKEILRDLELYLRYSLNRKRRQNL